MLLPLLLAAAAPIAPRVATPGEAGGPGCLPAATLRGATVVALGVNSGSSGRRMPFMLAGSSYPVSSLPVTGKRDGPIVLVVAAYEPLLWDLSAVAGRVRAVVASGYYPQAVTGLPPDTPVRFSSSVGNFSSTATCGLIHYAYDKTEDISRMAADIRRAIGVHPRRFHGLYTAETLDLDGRSGRSVDLPALADVRTAVPIITEDDPASRAKMRMLPSASELTGGGPRLRTVEWDAAGRIVRDEGGPEPVRATSAGPVPMAERVSSRGGSGLTLGPVWLGLIAMGVWLWRRWRGKSGAAGVAGLFPPMEPVERRAPVRVEAAGPNLTELTALAAITDSEPLVVALHRYGREVHGQVRTGFDEDLRAEIASITDRHFPHAIARFRRVRPSLHGTEADTADEALTHAVERLANRLGELHAEQHRRDIAGVDEAARFIDARHPA